MKNKYFKKYKLNQLQKIKQTYKYIYIFRYNDLTINETISIKKKLKELNYKSLILNQNLTKIDNIFKLNIKGQGSVLIIYGNKDLNLINSILNFKKIELIYLIIKDNIYSNLKIKQIMSNNNISLNVLLIKPFLNFLYYLRKI
jgi:hypothetical protein